MDIYSELGVKTVINAAGTVTAYSGTLMPPEVTDAMAAASRAYVVMDELHRAAGKRIADLVGVEAAHVCASASAGIALMAAACMTGADPDRIAQLPDTRGMKHRFVAHTAHRNHFNQALRLSGGQIVEVGPDEAEWEEALQHPDAAAAYYTVSWFLTGPVLSLSQVAQIAHRAGLPLIVDAAAGVPPLSNLSRFLDEGADLVAFSGGKALRGPQASGLVLGRADLVEACRRNDCPNMGVGRPMKAGKEEIVGLVVAVERYVRKDHAAQAQTWERWVAHIIEALCDLEHVRVWRQFTQGSGYQIPHVAITWDVDRLGLTHEEAVTHLLGGTPRIALQFITPQRFPQGHFESPELRIFPHSLVEGEEIVVARRLREELSCGQ